MFSAEMMRGKNTLLIVPLLLFVMPQLNVCAEADRVRRRSASEDALFHSLSNVCNEYVNVEEVVDPIGNPGMLPCVSNDVELEDFYKTCSEPDLSYWRQRAPLSRDRIDKFIDRWSFTGFQLQSMILIYKNRWYYPFLSTWNHSQKTNDAHEDDITLWIGASQYYFEKFSKEIEFPDVFFFQSDQDSGWCGSSDSGDCDIPAFSIAKNVDQKKVDILYPFMVQSDMPLYNFPFELKHDKAFFSGRPNWGASPKYFPKVTGDQRFFSRAYLANLSMQFPDKVMASIITGNPSQYPGLRCTSGETHLKDHARWKFLMHLDGVTYSFRLSRIMHTNSVILKEETYWPEYYVRAMQPYVHYLPFFKDSPNDVLDVITQWQNKTLELKRIAFNSQQFALRYLCPRARMMYLRRLLNDYKALFFDPTTGHNVMTDFIEQELVPILQARERGDMNYTYRNMVPHPTKGHHHRRRQRQ